MNEEHKRGVTWLQVFIVGVILVLLGGLALPLFTTVSRNMRMEQAINNARQIVVSIMAWAEENEGTYPDSYTKAPPKTANEAFRLLIKAGIIEDERIFTAPASAFINDNDIGEAPDYLNAVEPGENHWCLVKGVNREASGNTPLIFEDPSGVSWPPAWNCDVAGQPREGRAWKGGKIMIGLNDGSVGPYDLASTKGAAVPLKKDAEGKDLFTRWLPNGSYLDVER